jgi:hypothetical protein
MRTRELYINFSKTPKHNFVKEIRPTCAGRGVLGVFEGSYQEIRARNHVKPAAQR